MFPPDFVREGFWAVTWQIGAYLCVGLMVASWVLTVLTILRSRECPYDSHCEGINGCRYGNGTYERAPHPIDMFETIINLLYMAALAMYVAGLAAERRKRMEKKWKVTGV